LDIILFPLSVIRCAYGCLVQIAIVGFLTTSGAGLAASQGWPEWIGSVAGFILGVLCIVILNYIIGFLSSDDSPEEDEATKISRTLSDITGTDDDYSPIGSFIHTADPDTVRQVFDEATRDSPEPVRKFMTSLLSGNINSDLVRRIKESPQLREHLIQALIRVIEFLKSLRER
jgi:hypothetical protein